MNVGRTTNLGGKLTIPNYKSQYLYTNLKTIAATMCLNRAILVTLSFWVKGGLFFIETQTTRIPSSKFLLFCVWLIPIEEV